MIDWFWFTANALWILGCALALSTLSYASWEASTAGETLRARLRRPGVQAVLSVAGLLFCAGLAGTAGALWEKLLWAVLGILFLVQALLLARSS